MAHDPNYCGEFDDDESDEEDEEDDDEDYSDDEDISWKVHLKFSLEPIKSDQHQITSILIKKY